MTEPLVPEPDESARNDAPTETLSNRSNPPQVQPSNTGCDGTPHPESIGPYRIIRLLGEGGMGTVYLAEQTVPIHRRVALKIIKLGMDTRQTIARFEAEREALAVMNHTGVAKVFDAGVSGQGRPYFVMEFVEGVPITEYCDRQRLDMNDRLRLFVQVCHAVQHAHQKGIIHRDIKPSNILVAKEDGKAVPKVIDFGIAKATQQRFAEETLFTEQGQLIGTPGYMSPEQAGLTARDIDTRTDIYALGVLLYELLVGVRPFDDQTLRRAGMAEIQRIIREVDPPKPSTRLGAMGGQSTQVVMNRRIELRTLSRILRGDLDWVVMKCLEKDRNRRYDTANGLAIEVQRFLQNEPVLAGPPSSAYRLRKLVKRHKIAISAITAIVLALAVGLSVALWGMTEAQRQRFVAEQSRIAAEAAAASERMARSEAELARAAEAARAQELEQVVGFQEEQLAGIDVAAMGIRLHDRIAKEFQSLASAVVDDGISDNLDTIEILLGRADLTGVALALLDESIFAHTLRAIDQQFATQPLVRAQLLQTVARTARRLGLLDRARAPQESALDIRRSVLGNDNPMTLRTIKEIGVTLQLQGKLDEAAAYYDEALNRQRQLLGDDHPDTRSTLLEVAKLQVSQGRFTEAAAGLAEVIDAERRFRGDDHPITLEAKNSLGVTLVAQGKLAEAEAIYREVLEKRRRVLGEDHRDTLTSLSNLAGLLTDQDRNAEAESFHREVLQHERTALGDDHPTTLKEINNLGYALLRQNKLAEAEPYLLQALAAKKRKLGIAHPSTLTTLNNVATLLFEQGKLEEAEPLFREGYEVSRSTFGDEHPMTVGAVHNLAYLLNKQGKYAENVDLLRDWEKTVRKLWAGGHPRRLGGYLSKLGEAYLGLRNFDAAEQALLEGYDLLLEGFGANHKVTAKCVDKLILLYDAWHMTEPNKEYDLKAELWRRTRSEMR